MATLGEYPSVKQALVYARSLIEDETKWCRGYGIDGEAICAVHAIQLAARKLGIDDHPLYVALARGMGYSVPNGIQMGRWNDANTHADVLKAFDNAINLETDKEINDLLTSG